MQITEESKVEQEVEYGTVANDFAQLFKPYFITTPLKVKNC